MFVSLVWRHTENNFEGNGESSRAICSYRSWTLNTVLPHRNLRFEIKKYFSYYVHFSVSYRYIDMWLGQRSLCCDYATGFESREGWDIFSLLQKFQTGLGGTPEFFGGVKRQEYKADLLPPSWAEVQNDWRYTSTPLVCLRGMDRYSFTRFSVLLFFIYTASTVTLLSFSFKPLLSALRWYWRNVSAGFGEFPFYIMLSNYVLFPYRLAFFSTSFHFSNCFSVLVCCVVLFYTSLFFLEEGPRGGAGVGQDWKKAIQVKVFLSFLWWI